MGMRLSANTPGFLYKTWCLCVCKDPDNRGNCAAYVLWGFGCNHIQSAVTYSTASDRVMNLLYKNNQRTFTTDHTLGEEDTVVRAALCAVASNKAKKDIVIQLITYVNNKQEIKLKALLTDVIYSNNYMLQHHISALIFPRIFYHNYRRWFETKLVFK